MKLLLISLCSLLMSTAVYANQKLSFDINGGVGSINGESYSEVQIGLNYFPVDYVILRAAGVTRFGGEETLYGADLSAKARYSLDFDESFSIGGFAGPGYRIMSRGLHAPFVEGGVNFTIPGLSLGLGYKFIMNESTDNGLPNDSQFFIIFSGGIGGVLSF